MRVGLHDADATNFPNYALMKISAWHKAQGDTVEWWTPMFQYDRVYSSKVFTFTHPPECDFLPPDTIKGGTGYGLYNSLPDEIDDMFPDYSIYPKVDYAIGFLTRGCIRSCPWCIVPRKEGKIRPYRTWQEVKRPDSKKILFMDNNVLACPHGIEQMQDMIGQKVRIDFNQGLDARLITPEIADILSRLKWIDGIRMSCDTDAMLEIVLDRVKLLESCGVSNRKLFVNVLVEDVPSAEKRCLALRDAGVYVFAQPFRDYTAGSDPAKELKEFAHWVNDKKRFNTVERFADYVTWNKVVYNKPDSMV